MEVAPVEVPMHRVQRLGVVLGVEAVRCNSPTPFRPPCERKALTSLVGTLEGLHLGHLPHHALHEGAQVPDADLHPAPVQLQRKGSGDGRGGLFELVGLDEVGVGVGVVAVGLGEGPDGVDGVDVVPHPGVLLQPRVVGPQQPRHLVLHHSFSGQGAAEEEEW